MENQIENQIFEKVRNLNWICSHNKKQWRELGQCYSQGFAGVFGKCYRHFTS